MDDLLPITALVVDDDPPLLALASRFLSDEGFTVVAARSGEAALDAAAGVARLGLLFTDVVLPGRSGVELAAALRAADPALPVLLTTGHWQGAVRDAIDRSGHHMIPKPYDSRSVALAVRRAVSEPDPGITRVP